MEKIDFVVTWLDSDDEKWKQDYLKYKGATKKNARFRNWGLFKYWFRSIENYAPWVNKIYLVTNGQFPNWINQNHPKLVLVKHSDYIPEEYLPTFNSHTIELHMHNIPGLSEYFVYFNDDFYLNAPIDPDYYFIDNLPCDDNRELLSNDPLYNPLNPFNVRIIEYCCVALINYHFKRKDVVKQNYKNWFSFRYGVNRNLKSFYLYKHNRFEYFIRRHNEQPFLKSMFKDAWDKEENMLRKSCSRFRNDVSLSPYFIRYWQFATNNFHPIKYDKGRFYVILNENLKDIENTLYNNEVKSLCLNDSTVIPDESFGYLKDAMIIMMDKKFPNKSSFEI